MYYWTMGQDDPINNRGQKLGMDSVRYGKENGGKENEEDSSPLIFFSPIFFSPSF
jgi:hypothetical protein